MTVLDEAVAKAKDCHRSLEELSDSVRGHADPRACIVFGLLRAAVAVLGELVFMFETSPLPAPPRARRGRR